MRNLKRALSLALASIMMLGLMVVGAGAIGVQDFSDADEIQNVDAVSTMVALGVINGTDEGIYDPAGNVTRGQMAKMLCVAMNSGKDPVLGTKAVPTYSDIKGNWAESYIEYCSSLGIIAGKGEGKFDPNGNVTSTEAAKMILVAMGYNAENSGLVGGEWAIKTNVLANGLGLYTDLETLDTTAPMSRDSAAQMLYNALDAKMVALDEGVYKTSQYQYTTETTVQSGTEISYILNALAGASTQIQALAGNTYDTVTEAKAAAKLADAAAVYGTAYTVDQLSTPTYTTTTGTAVADETFGHKYLSLISTTGILTHVGYNDVKKTYEALIGDINFTGLKEDPSQFMQENMKVLYKKADSVFGIYQSTKGSVLATGYAGDITEPDAGTAMTVKVSGTTYKLDNSANSTTIIPFNQNALSNKLSSIDSVAGGYTFKLIDQDGNNKADVAAIVPFAVGKVTYVGKQTISANAGGVSGTDLEDVDVYEDVAKDDMVVIVPAANTAKGLVTITEADLQTGVVSGTKSNQYLVDGTWMKNLSTNTDLSVNDEIDYIAFGSRIYYAEVTSGSTGTGSLGMFFNVAFKDASGTSAASVEAKIILADGTKKTVKIAKINGTDVSVANTGDMSTAISGKDITGAVTSVAPSALAGALISYEVNSDNDYEIKTIPADYSTKKVLGYTGTLDNDAYVQGKDDIDGKEIAKDATVFVYGADKTAKVISGRELVNSNITGATQPAKAAGLYGTVNGFQYAQVVLVNVSKIDDVKVTAGANYGYLTADAYTSKVGTDTYTNYTLWTKNGELEVAEKKDRSSSLDSYKAGTVVTFDTVDADTIKNVIIEAPVLNYVTGYNEKDNKVQTGASSMTKITEDTTILYINSKDKTGVEGGSISIADKPNGTAYQPNVLTIDGTQSAYALIIVDVNNKMQNVSKANVGVIAIDEVADEITADSSKTVTLPVAAAKMSAGQLKAADGTVIFDVATELSKGTTGSTSAAVYKITINGAKKADTLGSGAFDGEDASGNAYIYMIVGNKTGNFSIVVQSGTAAGTYSFTNISW